VGGRDVNEGMTLRSGMWPQAHEASGGDWWLGVVGGGWGWSASSLTRAVVRPTGGPNDMNTRLSPANAHICRSV
jgi:hypothetical protein